MCFRYLCTHAPENVYKTFPRRQKVMWLGRIRAAWRLSSRRPKANLLDPAVPMMNPFIEVEAVFKCYTVARFSSMCRPTRLVQSGRIAGNPAEVGLHHDFGVATDLYQACLFFCAVKSGIAGCQFERPRRLPRLCGVRQTTPAPGFAASADESLTM